MVCISFNPNLFFIAIIDIKSDAKDLTFTVTDPKGKKLEEQTGKSDFKYHFAAFTAGNH